MRTSKEEIREWLREAKQQKATHLVVRSDDFSHEYYPVYCFSAGEARSKAGESGNMQRTIEVYNIRQNWDEQLSQHRVWNF